MAAEGSVFKVCPLGRHQEGARSAGGPGVRKTAAAVFAEKGRKVGYTVGTMIEVPRAA